VFCCHLSNRVSQILFRHGSCLLFSWKQADDTRKSFTILVKKIKPFQLPILVTREKNHCMFWRTSVEHFPATSVAEHSLDTPCNWGGGDVSQQENTKIAAKGLYARVVVDWDPLKFLVNIFLLENVPFPYIFLLLLLLQNWPVACRKTLNILRIMAYRIHYSPTADESCKQNQDVILS